MMVAVPPQAYRNVLRYISIEATKLDLLVAYARDGAVALRGVISSRELALLARGLEDVLARPSSRHGVASSAADPGRFFEDFQVWRDVPSLEEFVRGTRLARIAAELLGSVSATLHHDHVLVKEPGTQAETPYHQDHPFYDVEGPGVSFWIPVDPVAEEESLEVFAGTHRGPLYLPRTFLTKEARWHTPGELPEVPTFSPSDALRWALAPGDCIAFSFRVVHGAAGVRAAAPRRRVYSLRFVAHNAVHAPRPWRTSPQLSEALRPGEMDERVAGAPLRGALFPTLFSLPLNFARFPLHDAAAQGGAEGLAALVATARAAYEAEGAAVLPDFLTPEALAAMAAEAEALKDAAFLSDAGHNVYQDAGDPSLPADNARNVRVRTVVASIAYDELPRGSQLRALYEWLPLREFVRRVVGAPEELHPLDCPIGACTVNVFKPGMEQGWHFDEAEFSVTLMLTAAEAGGHFDFAKGLREAGRVGGPAEAAAIGELLTGETENLRRLPLSPGTLSIFRGHTALHRVTPVEGARTRLVAVLTFSRRKGVKNSAAVTRCFWGRTEPRVGGEP